MEAGGAPPRTMSALRVRHCVVSGRCAGRDVSGGRAVMPRPSAYRERTPSGRGPMSFVRCANSAELSSQPRPRQCSTLPPCRGLMQCSTPAAPRHGMARLVRTFAPSRVVNRSNLPCSANCLDACMANQAQHQDRHRNFEHDGSWVSTTARSSSTSAKCQDRSRRLATNGRVERSRRPLRLPNVAQFLQKTSIQK